MARLTQIVMRFAVCQCKVCLAKWFAAYTKGSVPLHCQECGQMAGLPIRSFTPEDLEDAREKWMGE